MTSSAKRIALATAGGLVSCLLVATAGGAAEIKVLDFGGTDLGLERTCSEVRAGNRKQT